MAVTNFDNNQYKNNADLVVDLTIDINHSKETLNETISSVVKTIFLRDESKSDGDCIKKIDPLTGGLSNHLYVITISQQNNLVKTLVRIHCDNDDTDGFVDRNTENKLLAWLSSHELAPIYYGRFNNGRVEEFYDGYRSISWEEMATFGKQIATKMAELHALKMSNHDYYKILGRSTNSSSCDISDIWERVQKWINLAESKIILQNSSDEDREEVNATTTLLKYLSDQWEWLQNELSPASKPIPSNDNVSKKFSKKVSSIKDIVIDFCNEVVLTHMDCQSLNILTSTKDIYDLQDSGKEEEPSPPQIHVIDYEYAGMNSRVMDIANTFCEYCDMNNLKADYETQYPNETEQNDFLRTYVSSFSPCSDLAIVKATKSDDNWDEILTVLRHQVGKHTLVSHLCWAIWSLAQHHVSSIEFDYLKYAELRLEGYEYFKSKYWK